MGKKILLADDSITIQKVIELTFSDEDFEVVTVSNGRLAVERVQEVRPDIVLCDIIMPEKDGYEVCDFVKKTPALSHIPVLLLTGAFEPFDKEKAGRVKADGFLAKPFEPQALIAKVKDLLSRAGAKPAPAPAPAPPPPPVATVPVTPAPLPEPKPEPAPEGFTYVDDSFEPIPEDAVTVSAAEPVAESSASTLAFQAPVPASANWTSAPTVEVSLEARARAGAESAHPGHANEAPVFEEVFDEPEPEIAMEPPMALPPPPVVVAAPPPPIVAPPPVAPPPPPPIVVAPPPPPVVTIPPVVTMPPVVAPPPPPPPAPPAPEPVVASAPDQPSFADMAEAEPEPLPEPPSEAANVPVPVDMVEKIAQRVISQISEKVVREIAWEVIPDLAEALIKQEIERLKAELQKT